MPCISIRRLVTGIGLIRQINCLADSGRNSWLKKLKNSNKIKRLEKEIKEYKDYNDESLNKELKDKREEIQLNDEKIKENIKVKKDIEYVLDINKKVNERFKDVNRDRNKEDIDRNI